MPLKHASHSHICGHCLKPLRTSTGLRLHIRNTPSCRRRWEQEIRTKQPAARRYQTKGQQNGDPTHVDPLYDDHALSTDRNVFDYTPISAQVPSTSSDTVETATKKYLERFIEFYPQPVATIVGEGLTTFERWERENAEAGRNQWFPFQSKEEWELAAWLAQNVGHNKIDEFLKLEIMRNRHLSMRSKYTFFQKIDQLPRRSGMAWVCDSITITGNLLGENGQPATERLELWRRNPVECVRELIGNPAFREAMAYAPERVYSDEKAKDRLIDEMWTADWWWRIQGKLPAGATIAPVILASDKTKLSNFRGDQTAWPVYLSIGNIAKSIRRQVSSRATVLLGYIPVSKLECFATADDARRLAGYRLYHHCMEKILEPLIEAGTTGVRMLCADGFQRHVFPFVAAYVADHPEQCLITNVQENYCPRGKVDPDCRGEPDGCTLRDVKKTLGVLRSHRENGGTTPLPNGLRPVYDPFWANLPHCNIFACITPDILHQLHKGVFKDHLVSWITEVVGEDELDRRFKAMAHIPGIRHFKKGISHVQQWTGTEHKEMQKVFVVLVAGAVNSKVLAVVQALIDFIYHAQLHLHNSETLDAMRTSLKVFHEHKGVFEDLGIRKHFNIAKIHAMVHYVAAILEKGALDGYNTELSERLHIDFAKAGYRAGNRRDYIAHMAKWLERQDAVKDRFEYYKWLAIGPLESDAKEDDSIPVDEADADNSADVDDDGDSSSDIRFAPSLTPRLYRIAKHCPMRGVSLSRLQEDHLALDFLVALQQYVKKTYPRCEYVPRPRDTYNLYKLLKVEQPWNPFVDNNTRLDKVRAIAATTSEGRRESSPGYFDPVLVIEDLTKFGGRDATNTPLAGIRTARLRVIFELPPEFGRASHPLVYIEWYTPFQRYDASTKLYQVSRSTRNRRPNAEVVSADRILGLCHLAGKCGAEIPREWTSANVLDQADMFLVNPYTNLHGFTSSGLYTSSYLM
ncbi:hypothetical protein BC629DRAFT_1596851 [Irpex lacteus]|nr:hypothetical protein BC629DRAFT_1596851 [Irpex lacteus]